MQLSELQQGDYVAVYRRSETTDWGEPERHSIERVTSKQKLIGLKFYIPQADHSYMRHFNAITGEEAKAIYSEVYMQIGPWTPEMEAARVLERQKGLIEAVQRILDQRETEVFTAGLYFEKDEVLTEVQRQIGHCMETSKFPARPESNA